MKITKGKQKLKPSTLYEPHFQLNQSFARTRRGAKKALFEPCFPIITHKNEITGSVIYEDPSTGQIILNWYETKFCKENLVLPNN